MYKRQAQYDVRSGQGSLTTVRSMSGGNQQKAIIAREIDRNPKLLVAVPVSYTHLNNICVFVNFAGGGQAMQLYFAVPDTATTHDGVLVRIDDGKGLL